MPETTAYHEAGHTWMAYYCGARVRFVTIEPDRDDGPERFGEVQVEWAADRFSERDLLNKSILVALAGPVAEAIHRGEPLHPGFVPEWTADWQEAWQAAASLVPHPPTRLQYLEQATSELYRLLNRDDHWAGLATIVDHLLAHGTLETDVLNEILPS